MNKIKETLIFLAVGIGHAQTFSTLVSFNSTDGSEPGYEMLVQGTDGNFYGTTERGGTSTVCAYRCGTIFRVTSQGVLTTLLNFNQTNGANPYAGLVLATNGEFYGTTSGGGANKFGTIFTMTPEGAPTVLHSFDNLDGANPWAALVQATNGDLYGTTSSGGAYPAEYHDYGTIFSITLGGTFTSLFSFNAFVDGYSPIGALIQAGNGDLYGTTYTGGTGSAHDGTIFGITPGGTLANLFDFDSTDGGYLWGGLVQASDGNFYGTTAGGGSHGQGTIFRITPAGELQTLYNFCPQQYCPDGAGPTAGLIQATDGNFYGTTKGGGTDGLGTVFEFTPEGTTAKLKVLHSFTNANHDGYWPLGGLLQATDGNFYGTTFGGGPSPGGDGTVFRLSTGLGQFVKTVPTAGNVGAAVTILGTKLTGATSVTFNGKPSQFTINSSGTSITTSIPAGATTGKVEVTTPHGTLTSNIAFSVL